jgi:hypothetical protein
MARTTWDLRVWSSSTGARRARRWWRRLVVSIFIFTWDAVFAFASAFGFIGPAAGDFWVIGPEVFPLSFTFEGHCLFFVLGDRLH